MTEIGLGLKLKQQQEQKLNQQMIYTLRCMQMNYQELNAFLIEEAMNNPLLLLECDNGEQFYDNAVNDEINDNYYVEEEYQNNVQEQKEACFSFTPSASNSNTLKESLMSQLNECALSPLEDAIGTYIISTSLDSKGFFSDSLKRISDLFAVSKKEIGHVLYIIQGFYPNGIGGRDIRESFIIQLRNNGNLTTHDRVLIKDWFEPLIKQNFTFIQKKSGIKKVIIKETFEKILDCNPHPAKGYGSDNVEYIIPELEYLALDETQFKIKIIDDLSYKVRYNENLNGKLPSSHYTEFKKSAQLCISALNTRLENLLKITHYIFTVQKDFYRSRKIYPLSMESTGKNVGLSTSTVSRIVNGKYIQFPFGVYELKEFFGQHIIYKGVMCSLSVEQQLIQNIIDEEDKMHPYSDDELVSILKKEYDIQLSRRTVAKYRNQLCIPSSYNRKG